MFALERIISGGQTGADQGGLMAAETLGLETGGWMPKGWRTDAGPMFLLAERFRMTEHTSATYPPRTKLNVMQSDGTLLFGNGESPGSLLTHRYCQQMSKPLYRVSWKSGQEFISLETVFAFRRWLTANRITVLNVAGNRESTQPGINAAVQKFLIAALKRKQPPAEARCEEASPMSRETYIPCGAPAKFIVKNRDPRPYNMCAMCADHNVVNRGACYVMEYEG